MRGEYNGPPAGLPLAEGSPPHAWGIPLVNIASFPPNRITPTCVGNTFKSKGGRTKYEDHPHMRGEY